MEHNLETLEHQTAPESTRGLFDPPEQTISSGQAYKNAANTNKRRSFNGPGPMPETNSRSRQGQSQRHSRGHQRSKSAITSDMLPNQTNNRRNTNFGLHTLAEEEDKKKQDDQAVTVDSLNSIINTIRTLPPVASKEEGSEGAATPSASNSSRRNSRRSTHFGLVQGSKRMSSHNGHQRTTSVDGATIVEQLDVDRKDRRRSNILSQLRTERISEQDEQDTFVSREAALAEAEAKLMGTFTKKESTPSFEETMQHHSRSSSSSDDNRDFNLRPGNRRFSDSSSGNGLDFSKRVSLQLPTLSEHNEETGRPMSMSNGRANRRITFNKPLNLGNDSNVLNNRRSSRNFENDWRHSLPSPQMPYSPRSASYRNSFNIVPFTPTRVNFARDDANPHQRRPLFIAHLPFSAVTPLFRARQLVRGMLRVNKRNRSDAYVSCEDLDADIYVCGSRDRNRALEGDVVAIRLVDVEKVLREKKEKEEAKLARNGGQVKVRLPDEEDENEIIFGGDDDVDTVKPKYCGVVVAILERAQNQVFSGTLTLMRPNNKRAQEEKAAEEAGLAPKKEAPRIVWFKATDKRVPLIAIPIEQAPADFVEKSDMYASRLFAGSIKRWPITSLHPFGTLERELGPIQDLNVQTKAILADNNVTDTEFTDAVMKCLPQVPFQLDSEALANRRDLQTSRIFTIDANELNGVLDDALSIQKLGEDTYEVGVHVSDVTYFIKANSPLDKEARARAVQVDLNQISVPMVPRELTQMTNLVPGEPRLAFSVIWKMSSSGKILDTWFGKTVVKSCASLALKDAQAVLNDEPLSQIEDANIRAGVEKDIKMLFGIASKLRQARAAEGTFTQTRGELSFELDEMNEPCRVLLQDKEPVSIITKEFSLLANTCVGQKISSQFPEQALLRRHAPPIDYKIRELCEYASKHLGVQVDISSAGNLERSIESIQDSRLRKILSVLVLKTLQPPKYFCTGTLDILKYSHYALNVPLFTHFTAPSRRFSDIIVHRQLEAALTGEKRFYLDRDTVQKLAQHCNVKKEAALNARHQSVQLFLALYLHKSGTAQQQADNSDVTVVRKEALVVAVFDQYFDVYVPEINMEKRIHLANLPVWRSEFNDRTRTLSMYWKKGVDTTTGKHHPWSLSDDEDDEDDMDEEALLEEMRSSTEGSDEDRSTSSSKPLVSSTLKESTTATEAASQQQLQDSTQSEQPQQTQSQPSVEQPEPAKTTSTNQRRPEASRSTGKRMSMMRARLSDSTGFSAEQGSQTIKAMDKIQVIVSVEMIKTPPLIRILAANPFA